MANVTVWASRKTPVRIPRQNHSRLFANGISHYLHSPAPASLVNGNANGPVSMATWFKLASAPNDYQYLFDINTFAAGNHDSIALRWCGSLPGDPLQGYVAQGTGAPATSSIAQTTTGINDTTTWHHAALAVAANDDTAVWLDAGGKGTDSDTVTTPTLDTIMLGCGYRAASGGLRLDLNGYLALPCIWQGYALTDLDVIRLANGAHPFEIAPQHIVYFPDLLKRVDLVGGHSITQVGTVTLAPAPAISTRTPSRLVPKVNFLPGPNSGLTGPNSPAVWTSKTRRPLTDPRKRYKVDWTNPLSRNLTHLLLFHFGTNSSGIYDACGRLPAFTTYSGTTASTKHFKHRGRTVDSLNVDAGWYWSGLPSIEDVPGTLEVIASPGTSTWKSLIEIRDGSWAGDNSRIGSSTGFWYWNFSQYRGGAVGTAQSTVNRASVGNSAMNHVIGRSFGQTSRDLWVDGVQEATDTTDIGSRSTGKEILYTHITGTQNRYVSKEAIYGGYALTDDEIAELTRDPWQQVIIDPIRTHFIPSGKSASPVVTWRG